MVSPFDGMAAALNTVFGAVVTVHHLGGGTTILRGVFREMSVEEDTGMGHAQAVDMPTLRLQSDQVPAFVTTDRIEASVAPGRVFRILRPLKSGSPASDAFILYALEEVI